MLRAALDSLDPTRPVAVTTFREGDPMGDAPRGLYRRHGFTEARLIMENDYPCQRFVLPPRRECETPD